MKLFKALGVLVVVVGLGMLTVYAQERGESPRMRQLAVLAGRGAEIGVSVRDVDPADAAAAKVDGGVRLEEVRPGGPADKAGLKPSDMIVQFDGERVRSVRQFSRLVEETPPGRTVKATIVRDGKRSEVQITPSDNRDAFYLDGNRLDDRLRERLGDLEMWTDRMPAFDFDFAQPRLERGRLGITVQSLSSQLAEYFGAKDGVLVTSVADGSAADRAGIRAGDVITSIDGEPVRGTGDLTRRLRGLHGEISIGVVRDKKELTVKATLATD
jgi:serine protease Do